MFKSSLEAGAWKSKLSDIHPYYIVSKTEEKMGGELDDAAAPAGHTNVAKHGSIRRPRTKRAWQMSREEEVVLKAQETQKTPDLNPPCHSEGVLRKINPSDVDVS